MKQSPESTAVDQTPTPSETGSQSTRLKQARYHENSIDLTLPIHVLLTGSTGSLGAYLLDALLSDSTVTKITCLNRTPDAADRQKASHASRGLMTDFPPSRVEFLTCDLAAHDNTTSASSTPSGLQNLLGLNNDPQGTTYTTLLCTTTHIIHNAWPVDFNKHISTFQPQIQGIQNLITFTQHCTKHPILFFMSSVSVAGRWAAMPGALAEVPEIILEDWRLAKMGYGQSKLVAERLIAQATQEMGIRGIVCRVAQVGGPVLRGNQGMWTRGEWFPSLIATSREMGVVPETLGPMERVDWLPVDVVAGICVELLFNDSSKNSSTASKAEQSNSTKKSLLDGMKRKQKMKTRTNTVSVYHVVNPHITTWTSLLPSLLRAMSNSDSTSLKPKPKLKPIPFVAWVEELSRRSKSQGQGNTDLLPASKLLSFFDDLRDKAVRFPRTPSATLATKETVRHSETMRRVGPVSPEWVELWVKQWGF